MFYETGEGLDCGFSGAAGRMLPRGRGVCVCVVCVHVGEGALQPQREREREREREIERERGCVYVCGCVCVCMCLCACICTFVRFQSTDIYTKFLRERISSVLSRNYLLFRSVYFFLVSQEGNSLFSSRSLYMHY